MMSSEQQVLLAATRLGETITSWTELSNELFNPFDGVVAKAFTSYDERVRFSTTPEYRAIRELLRQVKRKEKESAVAGGDFVAIPSDLRESLTQEASRKGIAFEHLVLTKLAQPLP